MKKEILVVGIIFLFIGIAVAPGITANNSLIKNRNQLTLEKETVDLTVKVCGLNGGKQTVKLTKEEAEEVEQLFNSIRDRLNETETKEEAEEVFNEAIIELDKYGLLGDLSINQAQKLVTGEKSFNKPGKIKLNKYIDLVYDRLKNKNPGLFENTNRFCLIAGRTTNTFTQSPLYKLYEIIGNSETLYGYLLLFTFLNPFPIGYTMAIGQTYEIAGYYGENPGIGWIFTLGAFGIKLWTDEMYGHLLLPPIQFATGEFYPGISGFTGIRISYLWDISYYLGFADRVKIGPNPP